MALDSPDWPWRSFDPDFFARSAALVAPDLLGHFLFRRLADGVCGGLIVETEAYLHDDPACHAYRGRTARNAAMFGPPGRSYVYFIYGNHFCFNAVCQPEGIGEAVLIRALEPILGLDLMTRHRPSGETHGWTNGPAKLCQALRIDRSLNGVDLLADDSPIGLARHPARNRYLRSQGPIHSGPRIGISQARDLPLRFYFGASLHLSRLERDSPAPPRGRRRNSFISPA